MAAGKTYEQAWKEYLAALEQARVMIEADPACADPKVRDAARYLPEQMQAAVFQMQMASHKGYPLLNRAHIIEPTGLNWGQPNPDFDYLFTYLDGRRRYRVHGPRTSNAAFFDIIAFNGYFVDNTKTYFQGPINQFKTKDGGIEFFLGPQTDGSNQIVLDPAERHNVLTFRETLEDWTKDTPTPLRIECVDPPEERGPFLYPEADMVERLERASALVLASTKRSIGFYHRILDTTDGKDNQFGVDKHASTSPSRKVNNAHPQMSGAHCVYNVKPGQSLVIETEMPKTAVYWGIQLADLWWRTTDYTWNQSSLNRRNAYFGQDGLFRAVISHEDPGVQNWLNPVDNDRGVSTIRYYIASDHPVPRTKLVPSSEVLKHLPADTPRVSPEQRRAHQAKLTDAVLKRFNY